MSIKARFITQVGRQVPVVPPVVATNCHLVPARCGTGNANGDGVRFAARSRKSHHVSPGVYLHQSLCQVNLFRAVEGGHIASLNGAHDGGVHLRVTIAQGVGSNAHDAHVGVLLAVQVPDLATLGLAKVSRPVLWQEHFWPLGKQHIAARNQVLGAFPKFLARIHVSIPICDALLSQGPVH